MICDPCKSGNHCGQTGTFCTCQHKPKAQTLKPAGIESGEVVGDLGGK